MSDKLSVLTASTTTRLHIDRRAVCGALRRSYASPAQGLIHGFPNDDPKARTVPRKGLQPAELELALAALQELETRDQAIMRQWQMRLERAEYDAALAERRYQEVEPNAKA
jgi:hypothetical protein